MNDRQCEGGARDSAPSRSITNRDYSATARICKGLAGAAVIAPGVALHPAAARPGAIVVVLGELPDHDPATVRAVAGFTRGYAGSKVPIAVARRLALAGESVVLIICREPWLWTDAVDDVVRIRRYGAHGAWWRRRASARCLAGAVP